jgi:nucleotide-binding universal stress UspA family protein
MLIFQNVLVGIDLFQLDGRGPNHFSPPVEEAIKHGLWLAEKASASVTFFAAVDVPEDELDLLEADGSHAASPLQSGRQALDHLVDSTKKRGLTADAKLVSGEGWIEIIREVERGGHDMVIVGTRNVGTLQRVLFGSTAMQLLHHCPCPVWVTRPEPRPVPHNILVSSDFTLVSEVAVKLGLAIGELSGAKVNLLNAVDYVVDRLYSTGLLHSNRDKYHDRVKTEAREQLADQLARVSGGQPSANVELHIVEGESIADTAIVDFIRDHEIDLLVMGTTARSGLPGVLIGNTAERLLTQVPCSMLAVKPPDFKSGIEPPK